MIWRERNHAVAVGEGLTTVHKANYKGGGNVPDLHRGDGCTYVFAKTQRTLHLISVHFNTWKSNLYETKGSCWGKICMLSAPPGLQNQRGLASARLTAVCRRCKLVVRTFLRCLRLSPTQRTAVHHYVISPRTTGLYSESDSINETQKRPGVWSGLLLPWLILCRLGKEQLGRAFHRYSTSMEASTHSALVGACFRNLSACKWLERSGQVGANKFKYKYTLWRQSKCTLHVGHE